MKPLAQLIVEAEASLGPDSENIGAVELAAETWREVINAAHLEWSAHRWKLGLIGCSATKLDRPAPARELYTGDLFRSALRLAEARCERVLVLSAKHGAVSLDTVLRPYDEQLPTKRADLTQLAVRVAWELDQEESVLPSTPPY